MHDPLSFGCWDVVDSEMRVWFSSSAKRMSRYARRRRLRAEVTAPASRRRLPRLVTQRLHRRRERLPRLPVVDPRVGLLEAGHLLLRSAKPLAARH